MAPPGTKVVTPGPAVDAGQLDAQFVAKMAANVSDNVRLGSRSQAEHGRNWPVAGMLADEATDVAVIGPEIMTPFR